MFFRQQQGQALFAALLLLVAGIGALVFYMADPSRQRRSADEKTAAALAQAKEALIGWKLNDNNRPGALPCPDILNTGNDPGLSGSECASYIGRLPWKSLGLPDLRDGQGERLWYALSRNFRNHLSAEPINTDTKGTITVYTRTTGTVTTSEAVAVIFSAGSLVGTQDRSPSSTAACTAPSGTILRNLCAENYLETASTTNNAVNAGPYIAAQSTTTFNDRLLIVSAADVMIPVEKRAALEIIGMLQTYRAASACNCYPWPDISDGSSNNGTLNGRVPLLGASPTSWIAAPAPWLINNEWWWVFFYTLAGADSDDHSGGSLTLNGVPGRSVVLITTGTAGATRPAGSPGVWNTSWWSYYVDDSNNSDLGTIFITPTSTAYNRDRLYTLP